MATSSTGITEEENNYIRIFYVLLRVAPSVVREQFDRNFTPGGLKTELSRNKTKVIQPLFNKRVIHQTQWDLLYPVTGNPSSTTFDLTLMIVLIRHLTPIRISEGVLHSSDVTEGADLSRLKNYRNQVAHNNSGTLTDRQFQEWWKDITQAISRLGGNQYQQQCHDIKEKTFGNSDKDILTELRNIEKTNDPIPKGLKDVNCKTIKEWEDLDAIVFETRAIKCLLKMIVDENIVTVIGSPGCGKTTAIRHVALRLNKEQLYDIVPSVFPSDIRDYYDPERKQVFVFDNMCGKFAVHVQSMHNWNDLSDCIQKIIDGKHVKILLSCRSYIFHQFRNVKLLTNTSCDFLSSDTVLTVDERRGIAMYHLTENETKIIQDMKVFEQYDFFPLLCEFYGKDKRCDIRTFFTRPVSVIKDDLKCLMEEDNQTTFATLGLFVIYNNIIEDDMLSRNSSLQTTLDKMSREFRMPYTFSLKIVKEQLNNLSKSYTKKTGSCYSIIHDKIFDILVSFFGEHMFDLLIDLCHSDVLRDRYHLDTIQCEHDQCLIIVPDGKHDLYFERLCYHFAKGNMDVIFSNIQMQYESYRMKLIGLLKNDTQVREVCLSSGHSDTLFTIIRQGYADVLKELIDLKYDLHTPNERGMTPLVAGVFECRIECVELLLNSKCDPNICHGGNSPLMIASFSGHTEIVKLLLNNKADPNICCEGYSPLHYVYVAAETAIVKLLLNNKTDPNICYQGYSPLHDADFAAHTEIFKLLLNNKADPNICFDAYRLLYNASLSGHTGIVKLLLDNKVDPNICREGKSPLYIASCCGHTEIVKLLLDDKADPNICDGRMPPLLLASGNGHTEIVKLLLNNKADPNICYKGESPLYIASCGGHTEIVKLLLDNKADPNICYEGMPPLYNASLCGHTEIVKLLLDNKADPNICYEGRSPLLLASRHGHTEIVKLLLNNKADPNIRFEGYALLYNASRHGHTEIVKLLLDNKVDPNICYKGESPLYIASCDGHTEIVKLLLDNKADPNICYEGRSPLLLASRHGHTEIVKLLLNNKADPNICYEGMPPLYNASLRGHAEIVKLLLDNKADPNVA